MKTKITSSPCIRKAPTRVIIIVAVSIAVSGCFASSGAKPEISITETLPVANTVQTGWDYLDQGAYGAAIPAFQMAISKKPSDESLRFGLAEAYRYAGYSERAEVQYAKLLESVQYRNNALTGIGHIQLSNYDTDGAFEMFSVAVIENEAAWKAWLGLAQLRDLAQDWQGADEAYKDALAHSNDRATVLNNHGVSMLARGDAKTALVYFEMAAAIDPRSSRVQTNIDLAKSSLGDDADGSSYKHLDGKTRARKLNNQGYAAMMRGDSSEAEAYFQEAIDVHPSFYAVAHKNLQTLKTARTTQQ